MPLVSSVSETTRVFERAVCSCLTCRVSCQGTLNEGSSKQGNTLRAQVASNCVVAYQLCPSWRRNSPEESLSDIVPRYLTHKRTFPGPIGWPKSKPRNSSPPLASGVFNIANRQDFCGVTVGMPPLLAGNYPARPVRSNRPGFGRVFLLEAAAPGFRLLQFQHRG
jgi:hypothetical protein